MESEQRRPGPGPDSTHGLLAVSPGPARGFSALRATVRNNRDIYFAPSDSLLALRPFIPTTVNEVTPGREFLFVRARFAAIRDSRFPLPAFAAPGDLGTTRAPVD